MHSHYNLVHLVTINIFHYDFNFAINYPSYRNMPIGCYDYLALCICFNWHFYSFIINFSLLRCPHTFLNIDFDYY